MPEILLNCQNLQCPEPLIQVKRLLENDSPERLTVVVDNEAARENVTRFLSSQGYAVTCREEGTLRRITGTRAAEGAGIKGAASGAEQKAPSPAETVTYVPCPVSGKKIMVLILAPVMGGGDDELGARLMKNFVSTLPEMGESLWRVVLLNGGVSLAAEGSPVLEQLRALESSGVEILACGACLEHFGLLAKKAVGQTTNMLDVVTSMQLADSVLRI